MIKFLTINKTAWIGFLVALAASFIMAIPTHAQESPEDIARKHGVSFPIAELGGCSDYSACRNFCEDPVNASSCISFAKQKGFYKEESFEVNNRILETAKSQLGCDSKTSCLNFCEVPANFDKCDSFAKSQGLVGGHVEDPSKTQVLAQAKQVLGCDSVTGCQSYCSQETNRQKCSDFAKIVGLHGGEHQVGPGGCTSETTCKAFCSDPQNFQVCSGFTSVAGGTFTGSGGCNSEESCRSYCSQHEDECKASFGGPGGSPPLGYNPQEMCNKTPNCSWKGSTCQCGFYGETQESAKKAGEYAAYCQANPDKCKPGQAGSFDTSAQRQEFESYCRQNPDRCKPYEGTSGKTYDITPVDPATACTRYGCSWNGTSCNCSGISGGTYTPPPPGSGGQYDPVTECNKATGCSWTGTSCQCASSGGASPYPQPSYTPYPQPTSGSYSPPPSSYDPATECAKTAGCSWTGSTCQCSSSGGSTTTSTPAPTTSGDTGTSSSVQGVNAVRGLLQTILDWLRR